MKKRWLMTMMMIVSSISVRPMATWLPSRKPGSGQPHIMWPMERYISTSRKPTDAIRRRFSFGVSWSSSASSASDGRAADGSAPLRFAP